MSGNNRPPYRTPCAGWTHAWAGKKFQHGKSSEKTVTEYTNITEPTIANRLAERELTGDNCHDAASGCDTLCGEFPRHLRVTQVYTENEAKGDYQVCENIGHKNLQAVAVWHGHRPLNFCTTNDYSIKYRTATVAFNITVTDQQSLEVGGSLVHVATSEQHKEITTTVDANSGLRTLANYVNSYTSDIEPSSAVTQASFRYYDPDGTVFSIGCPIRVKIPGINFNNIEDPSDPNGNIYPIEKTTMAEVVTEIEANNTTYFYENGSATPHTSVTATTDQKIIRTYDVLASTLSETTFELQVEWSQETWRIPDSAYWGTDPEGSAHALHYLQTGTIHYSVELDDSVTIQDLIDGMDNLATASGWDLNDNVQYPWRHDEYLSVAPIVSRDTVRTFDSTGGYQRGAIAPCLHLNEWPAQSTPGEGIADYSSPVNPFTEWGSFWPDYEPFTTDWRVSGYWLPLDGVDPNSVRWEFPATPSGGFPGTTDEWLALSDVGKAVWTTGTLHTDRFTGAIMGQPSGKPGARVFDYEHETWFGCNGTTASNQVDVFGFLVPYLRGLGASTGAIEDGDETDAAVPKQATQWTNNYNACQFRPGAWVMATPDGVIVQWAIFTQIRRPSYNFARPCGDDRWLPDELTSTCVLSDDGSALTTDAAFSGVTGDLVYIKSDTNPGIYKITRTDDHNFVRDGALIAALPYRFTPDTTDYFIAKLRFADKPALCGRYDIVSAVQDGGNVIIESAAASKLVVHAALTDHVDFTGTLAGLGTNLAVVAIVDSTHFKVAGTLSSAYVSGGYVASNGAASYEWNDDQRKGDYALHTWTHDHADGATVTIINGQPVASQTCANHCLPFEPCTPGIVGWLPVGHGAIDNSHIETLPSASVLHYSGASYVGDAADHLLPFLWQGMPTFTMPDPLWQNPHHPGGVECAESSKWVMDYGACTLSALDPTSMTGGLIYYYPHYPPVEARCDVDDFPAFPTGVTLPVYLPDKEINGVDAVTLSPAGDGVYNGVITVKPFPSEHGFFLAERQCVCDGLDMSDAYIRQGIDCKCS